MSLRETVNRNPRHTAIVVGGLVVLCLAVVAWQVMGWGSGSGGGGGTGGVYYTTDGGKTWFPDSPAKVPPFDHDGKPALRVHVFKCGEEGAPFAGYLERINPAAHKRIQALAAKGEQAATELETVRFGAVEVMRPGQGGWVGANTPAGHKVATPECPGGDQAALMPVLP
jgi:hypothetical protein